MSQKTFNFKKFSKKNKKDDRNYTSRLSDSHRETDDCITQKQLEKHREPELDALIEARLNKNRVEASDMIVERALNNSKNKRHRNAAAYEGDMNKLDEMRKKAKKDYSSPPPPPASETEEKFRWWDGVKSPDDLILAAKKAKIKRMAQKELSFDDASELEHWNDFEDMGIEEGVLDPDRVFDTIELEDDMDDSLETNMDYMSVELVNYVAANSEISEYGIPFLRMDFVCSDEDCFDNPEELKAKVLEEVYDINPYLMAIGPSSVSFSNEKDENGRRLITVNVAGYKYEEAAAYALEPEEEADLPEEVNELGEIGEGDGSLEVADVDDLGDLISGSVIVNIPYDEIDDVKADIVAFVQEELDSDFIDETSFNWSQLNTGNKVTFVSEKPSNSLDDDNDDDEDDDEGFTILNFNERSNYRVAKKK